MGINLVPVGLKLRPTPAANADQIEFEDIPIGEVLYKADEMCLKKLKHYQVSQSKCEVLRVLEYGLVLIIHFSG